jgi:hypothetical protein
VVLTPEGVTTFGSKTAFSNDSLSPLLSLKLDDDKIIFFSFWPERKKVEVCLFTIFFSP